jgi:glycosyltransferase involved in cell wall biosynthesis
MEIIGICLIKNEDIYIERVLKNVVNFCDKIRVIDNGSEDNTVDIVKKTMKKFSNISLEHIKNVNKTHSLVEKYVGEDTWLFGVDGDEIYDSEALSSLRPKILNGEYQKYWMLKGYFYHLVELDLKNKNGVGYLAPPSKDPTKLFNVSLLKSWVNDKQQPLLHCQTHEFKNSKYSSLHKPKKRRMNLKYNWDNCPLRCIHTRMLKRSSKEDYDTFINARLNLTNVMKNKKHNFRKKYRLGQRVKKDVSKFFI